MASTTASSAPALQSSTSPSDSDNGGNNSMQRGANYFFGFLITFVVLLLIFVGCGVGSRRRFAARRRQRFLAGLDPWTRMYEESQENKSPPKFHEKQVAKGGFDWHSLMPLAVTLTRDLSALPSILPSSASSSSSRISSFFHSFSVPSWIPGAGDKPPLPTEIPNEYLPPPDAVQITVMIAMPQSSHDLIGNSHKPELQLGVARMPWSFGDLSTT